MNSERRAKNRAEALAEAERYSAMKPALRAIAEIVAKHPEWIEEEPELEKHLKVLFGDNGPTS